MKKQLILITDAEAAPATELIETLRSAGISFSAHNLCAIGEAYPESSPHPPAILCEISVLTDPKDLVLIVNRVQKLWPGSSIVACRRELRSPGRGDLSLDNQALRRLGFRAIADSPRQLPALLRQVEDVVGTGELKLPEPFKPIPDSRTFALPKSLRSQHLRGAFALLTSLHLASDQKEAGLAALAGVARLVPADRWSVFLVTQDSTPDAVRLESLAARNFPDAEALLFDQEWQRELIGGDAEPPAETESKAAREAITKIEAIRKIESGGSR